MFIQSTLTDVIRAEEWWEYKLAPVFAAFYATALAISAPITTLWRAAAMLLVSLAAGAAYVSVINDVADREDDRAAGKPNRAEGRNRIFLTLLIAAAIAAGIAFCFAWRHDPLLLAEYLAAWLAFSLYSLPPFRFKKRGFAGLICDALGAHLFPTAVAVTLVFRGAHQPVNPSWMLAVAVWSLASGIRGILWHQLTDLQFDAAAGVRTFARRHSKYVSARIGRLIVLPVEVIALAAMLWQLRSPGPIVALALYGVLVRLRMKLWKVRPVIVMPKTRFFIVLQEYYDVLLPVSILLTSALSHPQDWIVLAIHIVIFPSGLRQLIRDVGALSRQMAP